MSDPTKTSNFEDLLKSLNDVSEEAATLAKATPAAADDKTVAAAAADSGVDADAGKNPEDDDPEGEGEEFGKSLGTDAEGNPLVDATELVKSLLARQDSTEGTLAKALTSITGVISKQNDLIKSLQSEVRTLAGQGRGRKAVLAISDKPGITDVLAKSGAAEDGAGQITHADLLAKSQAANKSGAITGLELNTIDVCLRNGWDIAPEIIRKVAAA